MTKQILKPILIGVLIGTAFYLMPVFFFPGIFFFIFLVFVFRFLFWGGGWRRRWYHDGIHPAFADTIRKMSDEEYESFKKRFDHHRMSSEEESKK